VTKQKVEVDLLLVILLEEEIKIDPHISQGDQKISFKRLFFSVLLEMLL
jgi:hypothetical protein